MVRNSALRVALLHIGTPPACLPACSPTCPPACPLACPCLPCQSGCSRALLHACLPVHPRTRSHVHLAGGQANAAAEGEVEQGQCCSPMEGAGGEGQQQEAGGAGRQQQEAGGAVQLQQEAGGGGKQQQGAEAAPADVGQKHAEEEHAAAAAAAAAAGREQEAVEQHSGKGERGQNVSLFLFATLGEGTRQVWPCMLWRRHLLPRMLEQVLAPRAYVRSYRVS